MMQIPMLTFEGPEGGRRCIDLQSLLTKRARPLPYCLRVVLENVARQVFGGGADDGMLNELCGWSANSKELIVSMAVSRVMLPDSSGLPVLMDLAAARDAVAQRGADPCLIEPSVPVTLVVDHSLIVDFAGHPNARQKNIAEEYRRNRERYSFFKWAQQAFDKLEIVPPGAGIIHQVHLEKIAKLVEEVELLGQGRVTGPEFVLGCDSHTTMVNGLGLLAWGVGGIDGEAAALGAPYVTRIPRVVGVRLKGRLPAGATTTDLVLTVTEKLREVGVVGAFVEFFGPGNAALTVPERATLANMAPEYGATVGYFPIDANTIDYLRQSGRDEADVAHVESYVRAAGLFVDGDSPEAEYSEVLEIDLARIAPCVAGPKRPQDRVPLMEIKQEFREALTRPVTDGGFGLAVQERAAEATVEGIAQPARHGTIAIAAITSCTNTSNPAVMIGAGLLARNAVARGLSVPEWVKTSLAPGSRLVEDYLKEAGLMDPLGKLGFDVVGFGCTTCSGKSGPINAQLAEAIQGADLVAAAVLSGNRNFEGRIHKSCRASYLASPPLVVAFALAGRVDIDFEQEPLGHSPDGAPVFLRDLWPDAVELDALVAQSQSPERFRQSYATLFDGAELWQELDAPVGAQFAWHDDSTYICRPPFFELGQHALPDVIDEARVLVKAGESLTTDFVTPSGEILADSQAGQFLISAGVQPQDFNAVTQRRGNHEFMARITFANQRLKNGLVEGIEGGFTRLAPDAGPLSIYDAAMEFKAQGNAAIVLAGKDYGMGSSRDWAAKGPRLLGVRIILARSFERIHRANLIGLGVLPMVFCDGQSSEELGLSGFETYRFEGLHAGVRQNRPVEITATRQDGGTIRFQANVDVASAQERRMIEEGGMFASLLQKTLEKPA